MNDSGDMLCRRVALDCGCCCVPWFERQELRSEVNLMDVSVDPHSSSVNQRGGGNYELGIAALLSWTSELECATDVRCESVQPLRPLRYAKSKEKRNYKIGITPRLIVNDLNVKNQRVLLCNYSTLGPAGVKGAQKGA